jgi:hypothetical protein
MQKYALMFRICNNDQKPSKYAFAYAHMHFKKIRALRYQTVFKHLVKKNGIISSVCCSTSLHKIDISFFFCNALKTAPENVINISL